MQDKGQWERWPAQLLSGKTVGIFGVGLIAEYMAPVLKALDMTVIGFSGTPRRRAGFDRMVKRDDLLKTAGELDFLVTLAPPTPETRNVIGEKLFASMKPSAYLINVARGGLIDEAALIKALDSGKIAGAALDVYAQEPLAGRQSAVEGQEAFDVLASRRLFARLRGSRHADHCRQHGEVSCRQCEGYDQHRA